MTKEIAAEEFKDKHRVAIQSYPFTVVGAAFLEGALWAIKHSPEVLALKQAVEAALTYDPDVDRYKIKHSAWPRLKNALDAYRKSVEGG